MAARDMPAAEVDIDERLVRALLADQHPDLVSEPLVPAGFGWDNVLFRLGRSRVVRLPRREAAAYLIDHELRWLPFLARRLPLPVPAPERSGRPGCGFPWPWSICPWLPGRPALDEPPHDLAGAASELGAFVAALHTQAPVDAPHNAMRGGPLVSRDPSMREWLERVRDDVDARAVIRLWEESLDLERWSAPAVWIHGDLHPGNILVADGRLSGVVDFGDVTAGDPATDLAVAWMLFGPAERATFRRAAGAGAGDDATWGRGRGWALLLGMAMVANSADNPRFAALGRRTVTSALAG